MRQRLREIALDLREIVYGLLALAAILVLIGCVAVIVLLIVGEITGRFH